MTSCSLGDAMVIGMGQEMPFKYVVDQLVSGFVGFFLPDSYFFKGKPPFYLWFFLPVGKWLFRQFFQDHFMIIS